jgi:hypothetical protein
VVDYQLSRQVSNLNSSDPESDVLPITPRDNFEVANINNFLKITNKKTQSEKQIASGIWFLLIYSYFAIVYCIDNLGLIDASGKSLEANLNPPNLSLELSLNNIP